jgi:hypothetical protein
MMPVLDTELEAALKAMELGFHVRLIGTFDPDLICAPADVQAVPWLDQSHPDFDQFPVREDDSTIGTCLVKATMVTSPSGRRCFR